MNWAAELGAQLDWHWANQLRPRLEGVSDEEYFWEPVQGCWNVRPVGGLAWLGSTRRHWRGTLAGSSAGQRAWPRSFCT